MILLPPITREEDLVPAIELLFHGEALVIPASFRRPENLSPEIIWSNETSLKGGKNKLRCVRRKSTIELQAEQSQITAGEMSARFGTAWTALAQSVAPCPCG